ncbi:DUF937 domain-containing protein [Comamonas kerstersii]|uniref:DUF937 domain-containing protein n=1 Tax=Comamonas kerstersii TaxID=225992 RepID=UPI00266DC2C4|nr:DUF937 domain-containing protein [Comamonas kerstersii]
MSQQPSLAQELLKQLQGTPMQEMSQQLGVNTQQIQSAVGAAVPLLLGALGKNASQAQGAADLGSLLGAVLGGGASQSAAGNGAAILGHIFGNSRQQAEAGLGQATGLGDKAGQLLSMLAPIVMAFLANRVQAGQMDASTLGRTLEQERAQVQQQGGLGGGLLGSLLDQNGDGKLDMGDLFKLGSSFLSGRR